METWGAPPAPSPRGWWLKFSAQRVSALLAELLDRIRCLLKRLDTPWRSLT